MVSGITPMAGAVGLFVPFPTNHSDTRGRVVSGITPTAGAVGLFVPFPTIHDDTVLCGIKQQAVFFVHEAS